MKIFFSTFVTLIITIIGIFNDGSQLRIILLILAFISAAFTFVLARDNHQFNNELKEQIRYLTLGVNVPSYVSNAVAEQTGLIVDKYIFPEYKELLLNDSGAARVVTTIDYEYPDNRGMVIRFFIHRENPLSEKQLYCFIYYTKQELIDFSTTSIKRREKLLIDTLFTEWTFYDTETNMEITQVPFYDKFVDTIVWVLKDKGIDQRFINYSFQDASLDENNEMVFLFHFNMEMDVEVKIPISKMLTIVNRTRLLAGTQLVNFITKKYN